MSASLWLVPSGLDLPEGGPREVSGCSQTIDWQILVSGWSEISLTSEHYNEVRKTAGHLGFLHCTQAPYHNRLSSLLFAVWTRKASVASNKVFSVLGLYDGAPSVHVDYCVTMRVVLVNATKACIPQNQSLDLLLSEGWDAQQGNPQWDPWATMN